MGFAKCCEVEGKGDVRLCADGVYRTEGTARIMVCSVM